MYEHVDFLFKRILLCLVCLCYVVYENKQYFNEKNKK